MTQRRTVLHVITGLNLGGAERMLARLVTQSSMFDHEVVSLSPLGLVAETLRASRVPVSSLNMRRGQLDPFAVLSLRRKIVTLQPLVVQTWMGHADLVGTLAVQGTGVPIIWNLRNTYDSRNAWVIPRLCARMSTRPVAIIANSYAGKVSYESIGYRPLEWHIIPNGFELDRYRPDPDAPLRVKARLRINPKDLVVAVIARRHPMKDHEGFLHAARIVADAVSGVRFVLIGSGVNTDQELTKLIDQLGLHDLVLRPGLQAQVDEILPGVDLVVSSSRYGEGLPNVLGEAMSCAIPCVATLVGDTARLVGDTGAVVEPRDPAALAAAMIRLLKMPDEVRRELGLRARARIQMNYSIAKSVSDYETLYANLPEERPRPAR